MRKLTEKGKQSRDRIISAGDKLMREHGYEDMTLRMLAEEVDMSLGHLRYYFREKKDLLFVLIDVTIKNVWYGSDRLCSAWNQPFTTYVFAVHWFFLACSRVEDLRRIILQSMDHLDIQREFSLRFSESLFTLMDMQEIPHDRSYLTEAINIAFAGQFSHIFTHKDDYNDLISRQGSYLHVKILYMLMDRFNEADIMNSRISEYMEELTVDRLIGPFYRTSEWYVLGKNPFIV